MKIRHEYVFTPKEIEELCAILKCADLETRLDYKHTLINIVIDRLQSETREIADGFPHE